MTRLDRLILSEVVPLFVGCVLLFTSLVLAGGELLRFAEYLQKGESALLVGRLIVLTLPSTLNFTFPMAMLLATLLGFGRLNGDSEIVALTAAGVRFERIVLPVALFGLFVALTGLWFSNSVVPMTSRGRNEIIDSVKNGTTGSFTLTRLTVPLRNSDGSLNTLVHIEGAAELSSGKMSNVSIQLWQDGRVTTTFYAPRAVWKRRDSKEWTLYDYRVAYFDNDGTTLISAATLDTQERKRDITLDTPEALAAALETRPEDTETRELMRRARILRAAKNDSKAREFEVEVARRNALPFAAFCFALIGAPLGVGRQRSGRGIGFGLSVAITFAYWVGLQIAAVTGRNGVLPADISLMLPNLICAGVGLFLIRRVLRG